MVPEACLSNPFHGSHDCRTRAHDGFAAQGEKLKRNAGDRLPGSYVNFYRGNGCAVIPAFGQPSDEPCDPHLYSEFP